MAAQGLFTDTTREEEALASASSAYREVRKILRIAITRSKAACWKQLIQSVEEDPWGKLYKLVTRKLQGPPVTSTMATESVLRIIDALFPSHSPFEARMYPVGVEKVPSFTTDEVDRAVHRAQRKATALGLGNINSRILSTVH